MTFYRNTLERAAKWASIELDRLVTDEALRDRCKSQHNVKARFYVMAYMHATGRYSMPQIATALNLKDHTSVLHGLRRAHGHDGKGTKHKHVYEPLWNKEHFQNIMREDFPEMFIEESDWTFTSGEGWAA